jgi:hypothetical protein
MSEVNEMNQMARRTIWKDIVAEVKGGCTRQKAMVLILSIACAGAVAAFQGHQIVALPSFGPP